MPNLFTAEQVAEYFHIKLNTVYTWKHFGKIKAIKVHGRLLFREQDIVALIMVEGE